MLIGFDFDNTIVCYDNSLKVLASSEIGISVDGPLTKQSIKNALIAMGGQAAWTKFQGLMYGPGMRYAEPFPFAITTMAKLKVAGHKLCIISHRTRRPFLGPQFDLHDAAKIWINQWLLEHRLVAPNMIFFLETLEEKLSMIAKVECNIFLDDLPSVLQHKSFPKFTRPVLFSPNGTAPSDALNISVIKFWSELNPIVEG